VGMVVITVGVRVIVVLMRMGMIVCSALSKRVRMTVVVTGRLSCADRRLVVCMRMWMGVWVGMPVRAVIRHGACSFPPDSSGFDADSPVSPLQQHERLPGGLGSDQRLHHPTA
jgi:hypothetical protein